MKAPTITREGITLTHFFNIQSLGFYDKIFGNDEAEILGIALGRIEESARTWAKIGEMKMTLIFNPANDGLLKVFRGYQKEVMRFLWEANDEGVSSLGRSGEVSMRGYQVGG